MNKHVAANNGLQKRTRLRRAAEAKDVKGTSRGGEAETIDGDARCADRDLVGGQRRDLGLGLLKTVR